MSSFRLGNDGTLETERTTAVTGKVIRHRIWTSGGSKRRVTKIVREDEPSGMVATIEVNAHDPNTGLPRQVTATIATADGKSTLQAWFVIETIEPVAAGSEAVFTIDSTGVETVWDSDSDTFLRTRGWNRPVSLTELVDLCRARKAQK